MFDLQQSDLEFAPLKKVPPRPVSSALPYANEHQPPTTLSQDPRWQLVQRIAESTIFARAHQLRDFLLYSCRWVLENPGEPISEYDIAQNVMGRRSDFDAARDNIVRVQATHLRRRLENYFAGEGASEEILVVLPKGSYAPQFLRASPRTTGDVEKERDVQPPEHDHDREKVDSQPVIAGGRMSWPANPWVWVGALTVALLALTASLILSLKHQWASETTKEQAIIAPLVRNGSPVTIVLPDLGLSVVQNLTGKEVDFHQYSNGAFPETFLQADMSPDTRKALAYIGTRRAISYSELNAVLELVLAFRGHGITPSLRFARDIHTRDLGTGNVVLIGSRRSNLWVSLFSDRTNFRFLEDAQTHEFYFDNRTPQAGEQKRYLPTYTPQGGNGYIDVALLPNTTNSGFLLLLDGSDAEVNEAAIHYLLDGSLPSYLQKSLSHPQLSSFEVFLCGRHLVNEADYSLQVIGTRESHN